MILGLMYLTVILWAMWKWASYWNWVAWWRAELAIDKYSLLGQILEAGVTIQKSLVPALAQLSRVVNDTADAMAYFAMAMKEIQELKE